MLQKKLENILNEQVAKESYASQLYLSMASWVETKGYAGISEWFYAQAEEERMHMLKIVRFINERGGHAVVPALEQPPKDFKGVKMIFEAALEHEQMVTDSINNIVAMSLEAKDYGTHNWIQWFVQEQMEEESSVQAIIDKLNMMSENQLYMFDRDIMSMRGTAG
ncbi:MAG: ferritin [Bacteroidales bacterium]